MITVDYTATQRELARYDARKVRLDALFDEATAHGAIQDEMAFKRLLDRWEWLSIANIDRVYRTFEQDSWHLPAGVVDHWGLTTIRRLVA